jgi:hypothetical protein
VAGRQDGKEAVLSCSDGPFRAIGAVVMGRNILKLDRGLRGSEKDGEFSRVLIIQLDMSEGTRVRRKQSTGGAKSMYIGGRGAKLKGNKMYVIAVQQDKSILKTVVGWDGETIGEVGRSPLTAGDGAGAAERRWEERQKSRKKGES